MNKVIKRLFFCFTILLSSFSFYSCSKQDTNYETYTFEYGIDFHMIESNSIDLIEKNLDRYGNYGYKTGHPYFMSNWLPSITNYFTYEDYKNDNGRTYLLIIRKEYSKYDVKYSKLKKDNDIRYTILLEKENEQYDQNKHIFVDLVIIEREYKKLSTVIPRYN